MPQTSTDRFVNYWIDAGIAFPLTEVAHEYRCQAAQEILQTSDKYAFTVHHRKDGTALMVDLEGLAWDLERDDAADLISERQHDGLSRQVRWA